MSNQKSAPQSAPRADIYTLVAVGLMAALVFAATKIQILVPTALGSTRLHLGNVLCLLAGLLLGGFRGGLAAGIGSMLFDLTDPLFIDSAPFTLVFKFAMGYVCGAMAGRGEGGAKRGTLRTAVGCAAGSLTYVALYLGKSYVSDYFVLRNPLETVLLSLSAKGAVSLVNAALAVAVAVALFPVFRRAFAMTGFAQRLEKH